MTVEEEEEAASSNHNSNFLDLSQYLGNDDNDSDDDPEEEELFKPVFSQSQSSNRTSDDDNSVDEDTENPDLANKENNGSAASATPTATASATSDAADKITPEEYAKKVVEGSFELKRQNDLSNVYWCCQKKHYYPVVLASETERKHHPTHIKDNEKLVLFLGHYYCQRWKQGLYPETSLRPFYDDTASSTVDVTTEREWHPKHLKMYLNNISKLKEFKGADGKYKLLVEEYYLKHALVKIRENEQAKQKSLMKDSVSDDEGDIDNAQEDEQELVAPNEKTSTPNSQCIKSDRPKQSTCPANACHMEKPMQTLRAGDVVKYYPPLKHIEKGNWRPAFIVRVNSNKKSEDAIALELSDSTTLAFDHQVRLWYRLKNNKLVEYEDARFYHIEDFKLDMSMNDKLQIPTFADKVHEFYAAAINDMEKNSQTFLKRCAKEISCNDSGNDTEESDSGNDTEESGEEELEMQAARPRKRRRKNQS